MSEIPMSWSSHSGCVWETLWWSKGGHIGVYFVLSVQVWWTGYDLDSLDQISVPLGFHLQVFFHSITCSHFNQALHRLLHWSTHLHLHQFLFLLAMLYYVDFDPPSPALCHTSTKGFKSWPSFRPLDGAASTPLPAHPCDAPCTGHSGVFWSEVLRALVTMNSSLTEEKWSLSFSEML